MEFSVKLGLTQFSVANSRKLFEALSVPCTPEEKPRTEVAFLVSISNFVLQESLRDSMLKELVALRAPDADENLYATTSPMLKNDFGHVPEEEVEDENLKELVKNNRDGGNGASATRAAASCCGVECT